LPRIIFVTTVLVLALAATARAQDATISASLSPNTPAAGSKLHVSVGGAAPELSGALPESLTLGLQRGFRLDVATIAQRCDATHAPTGDCPAASRIGSGQALVHLSGLLTADVPASIAIFLADPVDAGDLASVVLRVDVGGQSRAVRARLVALPAGPFGYELRAAGFAAAVPTIAGVVFELRSLVLDLGVRRNITTTVTKRVRTTRNGKRVTVKRRVKRKVRHDLIRNPKTCAGSWVARVTVRIAGSDRARDVQMPCMSA
jgi:hypothetical protein